MNIFFISLRITLRYLHVTASHWTSSEEWSGCPFVIFPQDFPLNKKLCNQKLKLASCVSIDQ